MSLGYTITSSYSSGMWRSFAFPPADRMPRLAGWVTEPDLMTEVGRLVADSTREGMVAVDITMVRGVPTTVMSMSTTDPFGPSEASLAIPRVTLFDRLGEGDLWWCLPEVDVLFAYVTSDGRVLAVWEGYMLSRDYGMENGGGTLTVSCPGALHQLDNYLAKPEHLYAPMPFEQAIARQFENRPDLRVGPVTMLWPEWWDTRYAPNAELDRTPWMIPTNVDVGDRWSALVTRYTGQFEPVLTSYIGQLLSSMHSPSGQFTLLLDQGRKPVLRHRTHLRRPASDTLHVDLLWPGVSVAMSEDYSQRLNVVYATGKALNGNVYTGMKVTNDGQHSYYSPFAARRAVEPADENNLWLDANLMRREVQLSMAEGLNAAEAVPVCEAHLGRYADPGLTGTIDLTTNPLLAGDPFPRQAIQAGMSVCLHGLYGDQEGRMFHITATSLGPEGAMSLTVDSKFRDHLTVDQVRLRGRDALTPTRMLTTGSFVPSVPDQSFPWSYEMGAGYLPYGSQGMFRGVDADEPFPWVDWVKSHPPRDPQWRSHYAHIGPRSTNADQNWSAALPLLLSASGSSRLVQIAAYDRDGNVMRIGFHVSIYTSNSVSATAGPVLSVDDAPDFPPYAGGQHYPFFPNAWETVDEFGVVQNPQTPQAEATASIIIGWGTGWEKAGYWPGSSSHGDPATGLLVDESPFNWDLTSLPNHVNTQEPTAINVADPQRATVYVLIYAEDQGDRDVYFLGRVFRTEPGSS